MMKILQGGAKVRLSDAGADAAGRQWRVKSCTFLSVN